MSYYLDRLRQMKKSERPTLEPRKPTKAPSVGFVGSNFEAADPSVGFVGSHPGVSRDIEPADRALLTRWLDHIGETDPDIIAAFCAQVTRDVHARMYFLEHARHAFKTETATETTAETGFYDTF